MLVPVQMFIGTSGSSRLSVLSQKPNWIFPAGSCTVDNGSASDVFGQHHDSSPTTQTLTCAKMPPCLCAGCPAKHACPTVYGRGGPGTATGAAAVSFCVPSCIRFYHAILTTSKVSIGGAWPRGGWAANQAHGIRCGSEQPGVRRWEWNCGGISGA